MSLILISFLVPPLEVGFACSVGPVRPSRPFTSSINGIYHVPSEIKTDNFPSPIIIGSSMFTYGLVAFLLVTGYLLFANLKPVFFSRRDYAPIADSASRSRVGSGEEATVHGGAIDVAVQDSHGIMGRRWRAYGSTDEVPAGPGCLPTAAR